MSTVTAKLSSVQRFSIGRAPRLFTHHALRLITLLALLPVTTNSTLAQSANGLFGAPTVYSSGGQGAGAVAAADLNGDGRLDLVVSNASSGGTVGVLLGNGDGTFRAAVTYPSGGVAALSIAVADVNGDGRPDIVAIDLDGSVGVLLGNGDGTFQPALVVGSNGFAANSIAVADVNGDGKPDLLLAGGCANPVDCSIGAVGVLLGNGDGTFQAAVTYLSGGYWSAGIAVADVNGDGKPDLVVGNECGTTCPSNGTVGVLLGNGNGTFQTAVTYNSGASGAHAIAVVDLNGDGKRDLIVSNSCTTGSCTNNSANLVAVLLGNGDGTFQAAVTYNSGGHPGAWGPSVAAVDVNGDGQLDLLVANLEGTIGVLLGNGDGTFGSVTTYSSGGSDAESVVSVDLNGDHRPDLVVANYCGTGGTCAVGSISVLLNTGSQAGTPIYAPPGQIIAGFPLQLILDSAPTVTQSYLIDYAPNNMLFVVVWDSQSSPTSVYNIYKQYFLATGWTITNSDGPGNPILALGVQNDSSTLTVVFIPNGTGSQVSMGYVPKSITPSPSGLSAVVGNGTVYLRWDAPLSPPSGYNIYVNGVKANTTGLLQGTSVPVTGLQNSQLYEFGVTEVESGGESSPATVFAEPNGFVAPAHPLHPILFLHGINASASSWQSTATFLTNTLGWTCGGTLSYSASSDPTAQPPQLSGSSFMTNCPTFQATGDFFTVNFGDPLANYTNDPDSRGIFRQGDEVGGFIGALKGRGPLSLVGWSMGGLAARSYMQTTDPIDAPNQISDLITLGTPHWGVDRNFLLGQAAGPIALFIGPLLTSRGLIDMDAGCVANGDSTDYSQLSPFLQALDSTPASGLPPLTRYVVVSGLSYLRLDECKFQLLTTDWVVPSTSSTLAGILPNTHNWQSLNRPDVHTSVISQLGGTALPDDFPAILCALDQNCLELQVMSPVDIQVTAPNGLTISPSLTSMPGADYTNVTDANGHDTATVLIPFPQGGQYTITVTPKAGAQPTDTFTILQTQNGVTTNIANNMQIASIPPAGFQTAVKNGSSFQVNFGGSVQQPLTKDSSGRFVALVTITNQGNVTVDSAHVSIAGTTLGTAAPATVPGSITSLAPGASATVTLIFPKTAAPSSATTAPLKISGTYSAGTLSGNWTLTFRSVTLAH